MSNLQTWEIPPTIKLGWSLRESGHDYQSALADLMDNGFDADATVIKLSIDASADNRAIEKIYISDNGNGMSLDDIPRAFTYGSETNYSKFSIGCYGMGLKTAGTSIGRRITVYTKTSSGEVLVGIYDMDVCEEAQKFIVKTRLANTEDQKLFDTHVGSDSGTLVMIDKIDKLDILPKTFYQTMKASSNLPKIFRELLTDPEIEMYVGKVRIEADFIPPEYVAHNWTQLAGTDVKFRVIHDTRRGASGMVRRQGVSGIFMHDRNIITSRKVSTLGIWTPGWETGGVFVELKGTRAAFNGLVTTNFRKTDIVLSQSFKDKLRQAVAPIVNSIKHERALQAKKKKSENDDVRERMEKKLKETVASRMTMPEIKNENVVDTSSGTQDASSPEVLNRKTRGPDRKVRRRRLESGEQLVLKWINNGRHGRFVEIPSYNHRDKTYTLKINAEHPWVLSRLYKGCDDSVVATALDFIMAFGLEEMASENSSAFDSMMEGISKRMAQVVSATEAPSAQSVQLEDSILNGEEAA